METFRGAAKLLIAAIGLLPVTGVAADQEIFKWTGKDGTTHFSEAPPAADPDSLEVMRLEDSPAGPGAPVGDYRQALELANRLQADRLARERARQEQREYRLREREARLEAQRQRMERASGESSTVVVPYYGPPKHRPGYPPRWQHRPSKPWSYPGFHRLDREPLTRGTPRHSSQPGYSRLRPEQPSSTRRPSPQRPYSRLRTD